LTKLANLVQFKRMHMFCLEHGRGLGPMPPMSTLLIIVFREVWQCNRRASSGSHDDQL